MCQKCEKKKLKRRNAPNTLTEERKVMAKELSNQRHTKMEQAFKDIGKMEVAYVKNPPENNIRSWTEFRLAALKRNSGAMNSP